VMMPSTTLFKSSSSFTTTEVAAMQDDASKAKEKRGWSPRISFDELVSEMVTADFEEAKRHNAL